MTREEWINEFQILNGRKPNPVELQKWENSSSIDNRTEIKKRFNFNLETLIKIGIAILVAVFGYIVGYLFTWG